MDARGIRLRTNEEKGLALLERFIQQSDQKNTSERKAVIGKLNHAMGGSRNDDEITEVEFQTALKKCSKDTAPGPDRVRYSDIDMLTEQDKARLCKEYQESFSAGKVPQDWTHSYLKPTPKPGKNHFRRENARKKRWGKTTKKMEG